MSKERRAKSFTLNFLLLLISTVLVCTLIGLPAIPQAADIDLDPSVVLYLPFYKYGSEQQKAWDMSGYNNHGTIVGATPALIPMLSGVELVSGGSFETDPNVEWTPIDATIASVAGGVSGNCLEITRTGAILQKALQTKTNLVTGKRHKFSGWVKSGTSGDEAFIIQESWSGSFNISGTSSSTWTYYEKEFTCIDGTAFTLSLYKATATAGTMLFDQVSIQEVVGYTGGQGWQFDGVGNKITVPHNSSLDMTSNNKYSILIWMQDLKQFQNYGGIIGKTDRTNGWQIIHDYYSQDLWFEIFEAGSNGGSSFGLHQTPYLFDKPHLMALTIDGTTIKYYIDTELKDTNISTKNLINTTVDLTVCYAEAGINYSKLIVGEVQIFNSKALSAQEIRNIYELTRHRYGR